MSPYLLLWILDFTRIQLVSRDQSLSRYLQSTGWERERKPIHMLHPSLLVQEIDKEVQLGPTPYLPAMEWGSHPSNEKMEASRQIYDQGLVTNWTRTNTSRIQKRNPANFLYSNRDFSRTTSLNGLCYLVILGIKSLPLLFILPVLRVSSERLAAYLVTFFVWIPEQNYRSWPPPFDLVKGLNGKELSWGPFTALHLMHQKVQVIHILLPHPPTLKEHR